MRFNPNRMLQSVALGLLVTGCDGLNLAAYVDELSQLEALRNCDPAALVCATECVEDDKQQCVAAGISCECTTETTQTAGGVASSTTEGSTCLDASGCAAVVYERVDPRPSRSTTVDLTVDDEVLAMVNTDEGSLSIFAVKGSEEKKLAVVPTSVRQANSEPSSVAFHPSAAYVFVANRAAGTVSRIANARSANARVDAELVLGGEPIGLALDARGEYLWVTNWVSGKVSVVNTSTMQVEREVAVGGNPWAIAITNDGDDDAGDEKVLVTQFYSRARAGERSEASDNGREGVVHVIDAGNPTKVRQIVLAPKTACFSSPDLTSDCFPNQLYGLSVHTAYGYTRAYVVSVAASPEGPVQFNHNVQALVSVIDVDAERELDQLTTNLNQGVAAQVDEDGDESVGRRFANVPNAIEFENRSDAAIGYVTAAGSDIALRVQFAEDGTVAVGTDDAFNIATGQNPTGFVASHAAETGKAFASNLISRDVSVISLRQQRKVRDVVSTEQPQPGSGEFDAWKGKRFFNTATGIWSKEGWSSCQSCHPMGLTDNITWSFGAGPRQSIALDGQFASNDPTDMRALNWTAIFDETDDFENNTRGVSAGSGAIRNQVGPIVSPSDVARFAAVAMEDGVTPENHQALNGSMKFLSRNEQVCDDADTCPNWDQVDVYIQSIRSAQAYVADEQSANRGRGVFEDAGCSSCHSGAKWTVSRTFYDPAQFSGELGNRLFESQRAFQTPLDATPLQSLGLAADVVVDQTLIAGDDSDGGQPAFRRQACNLRNVGTFGAFGGADEVRANGGPAQGKNGFNPPSLLSMATGAPYFHSGAAQSVQDLFDDRFADHLRAGNASFYPSAAQKAELVSFLLSIDESTQPFETLSASVICPVDFSQTAPEVGTAPAADGEDYYDNWEDDEWSYDDSDNWEDDEWSYEDSDNWEEDSSSDDNSDNWEEDSSSDDNEENTDDWEGSSSGY